MEAQSTDNFIKFHPPSPTHHPHSGGTPSTIDLILANSSNAINDVISENALNSDHNPITCSVRGVCQSTAPCLSFVYKNADWDKFARTIDNKVTQYHDTTNEHDIDNTSNIFTTDLLYARELSVPVKTTPDPLFKLSDDTLHVIGIRNMVRRRWQRALNPGEKNALKSFLHQWNSLVKQKCHEEKNKNWDKTLVSLSTGAKNFWRITKAIRGKNQGLPNILHADNISFSTDDDKANALANSFEKANLLTHSNTSSMAPQVSLFMSAFNTATSTSDGTRWFTSHEEVADTIRRLRPYKAPGDDGVLNIMLKHLPVSAILLLVTIFNHCMTMGHWPQAFKHAKVIAIPKSGRSSNIDNYRPISLLSATGKVFEKLLLRRINLIADEKQIIKKDQFGFKQGHSTTHQLMRVHKSILSNKANRKSSGLLLLDFAKAFDTVWHGSLIFKLHKYGFPFRIVKIIHSFCTNREFKVHVGSKKSQIKTIKAGLGQGSVISPQLFALYTADLILPNNILTALFADDTALLASSNQGNAVIRKLQLAANALYEYMEMWKIKVNVCKTKLIFFPYNYRLRRFPLLPLILSNTRIPLLKEATYLGVTFDSKLCFKPHLDAVRIKALKCLRAVYPLLNFKSKLSKKNKLLLYKGVLRPILTYAAPLWKASSRKLLYGLQVVQNKCLKLILGLAHRFPTDLLHDISSLPMINDLIADIDEKFIVKCSNSNFEMIRDIANEL